MLINERDLCGRFNPRCIFWPERDARFDLKDSGSGLDQAGPLDESPSNGYATVFGGDMTGELSNAHLGPWGCVFRSDLAWAADHFSLVSGLAWAAS
jgi:hypothetical protein